VPHNQNRFFPITEAQVAGGSRSLDELRELSPYRPPMVFIDMPEDAAQASSLLADQTSSVLRQTERFRSIDEERLLRIIRASRTSKQYQVLAPDMGAAIERFVLDHGGNADAFAFVPLWGRFGYAMLALSRTDGSLVGVASREVRLR